MAEKDDIKSQINQAERFSENCYLLDHIETLAKINQSVCQREEPKGEKYQHFLMINDEPGDVIQELLGKKGLESLFTVTPAQLALLVPKINLYKVDYQGHNDKKGTDKPFIFQDYTLIKTLRDITNNRAGRGEDIGLKSFEYKFAGKNPAEISLCSCKLNLYFNSPQALLGDGPEGGVSFRELISYPHAKDSQNRDLKYHRIKIVAGWSDVVDPKGDVISLNSSLRSLIRQCKTILFLNLVKHDIEFRENGVLEVSLEYHGAMEGILTGEESNIFWLTEDGKVSKKMKEEIQAKRTEEEKKAAEAEASQTQSTKPSIKVNSSENPKIHNDNEVTFKVEPKTDAEKEAYKQATAMWLAQKDKQEKYSRLLKALHNRKKMFFVDVDQGDVEAFTPDQRKILLQENEKVKDINIEQVLLAQREKQKEKNKNKKFEVQRVTTSEAKDSSVNLAQKAQEGELKSKGDHKIKGGSLFSPGELVQTAITHKIRTQEDRQIDIRGVLNENKPYERVVNGKRRIIFFYLGDLLDTALAVLMDKGRDDNHNLKVILGTYVLVTGSGKTLKKYTYNLANIPIALNLFNSWYVNKVIGQQRENYFLGEFIKDVISELVISSLKPEGCFFSETNTAPNVGMTILSVPNTNVNLQPGALVNINALKSNSMDGKLAAESAHYDIKDLAHYLYIYVTNNAITGKRGNYKEDVKKGIYHIVLGADSGLVRSVKFSKNDIPMGKEVMASNDTTDQKRLPGYYNATISMVGNNIFSVGTMVYIDTSRLTYGNAKNLSYSVGLGGYYLITEVNHVVGKDEFITELTARWHKDANGDPTISMEQVKKKREAGIQAHKKMTTTLGDIARKEETNEALSSTSVLRDTGGFGGDTPI